MGIPVGLCQCGCGGKTNIAPRNDYRDGSRKGVPRRYLSGHRLPPPEKPLRYAVDDETGCWLWQGAKASQGYGAIQRGGKTKKAHRVAYEELVGPIPDGVFVCHHCDTPPCINPAHLFLGTRKDNADDRDRKGRNVNQRRAGHPMAKLTEDDVRFMRALSAAGMSGAEIQRRFPEVSHSQVCRIVSGRAWRE